MQRHPQRAARFLDAAFDQIGGAKILRQRAGIVLERALLASVTEARDNTVTLGNAARLEIRLSAMPAATKSLDGSPLMFVSGSTAITGGADVLPMARPLK